MPVGDVTDEFLNVDSPVAERAALSVRLRDLGLEGDDSLEPRLEIRHRRFLSSSRAPGALASCAGPWGPHQNHKAPKHLDRRRPASVRISTHGNDTE